MNQPTLQLLDKLYADAAEDFRTRLDIPKDATPREHFELRRNQYLAVSREFGHMLYGLVRNARAKTVVEFGTSFGISTIFLAQAVKDNGGGRVITTEFIPEKAQRAKQNLASIGLAEFVDFRVGDALETLKNDPRDIDAVFLDGAKNLYLPVLKLIEARLVPAALIMADNTDLAGVEPYLDYVRKSGSGYLSTSLLTRDGEETKGHEITFRS